MMKRRYWIYAPKPDRHSPPVYVGYTQNVPMRMADHRRSGRNNTTLGRWMEETGIRYPHVHILGTFIGTADDARRIERHWIQLGLSRGWPLVNRLHA